MLEKLALERTDSTAKNKLSASEAVHILGGFNIRDACCQVIVIPQTDSNSDLASFLETFLSENQLECCSEVARFTVNRHLCIILEFDASPDPESTDGTRDDCEISSLLTERELQIAVLVARGKVNKQIAKQLHISEWTVATYLRRMFAKLQVDSRAALVYRCAPIIRKNQEMGVVTTEG
jgi:DNA-binding CsgD family transcriptional regulator